MQKAKSALATFLALSALMLSGCESGKVSDKDNDGSRAPRDRDSASDPKKCVGIKSIEVLADGKTALSYISDRKRVLWRIENSDLVATDIPVNFIKASFDGRIAVSKTSGRWYQILELVDKRYESTMAFSAYGDPQFQFSSDSNILAVSYSLPNGADQVDVYNVSSRSLINSFHAYGIRYVRLTHDGGHLVVGNGRGWAKSIGKYDVRTMQEEFLIKLPAYLRFSFLDLSKSVIIAKIRGLYRVYSLANGDYLGSHRFGNVYAVDASNDLVLGSSNWGELEISSSLSGESLYRTEFPEDALLSSCVFSSETSFNCLRRGSNQVISLDFEIGASSRSCY